MITNQRNAGPNAKLLAIITIDQGPSHLTRTIHEEAMLCNAFEACTARPELFQSNVCSATA